MKRKIDRKANTDWMMRKSALKNQKGMTMVEVLVAFVILMIGLAGLNQATSFASKMMKRATDRQASMDQTMEQFYLGTPTGEEEPKTIPFKDSSGSEQFELNTKFGTFVDGENTLYYFTPDTSKEEEPDEG